MHSSTQVNMHIIAEILTCQARSLALQARPRSLDVPVYMHVSIYACI